MKQAFRSWFASKSRAGLCWVPLNERVTINNNKYFKMCSVMCETARLQVLLVLLCNKWWTLWILFIVVPFIYYLQQATVILTEVVCCKSKSVMSRAGWDMLVSRDHCTAHLLSWSWNLQLVSWAASLGYLYLIILRGPYNTLPLSGAILYCLCVRHNYQ